ncbi:MAG: 3-deoxy-manno-octulosonate cytidylyltransferase [Gammaproteobacteria bacterium]|nr:3-deoxy-manno-octulosonate cytidylyltransferase [Gammaproteobacteria bacterium]MDE2346570.1 3-deoxy-manno-octulosonate cytidylyltransferase [Gammaproteobacteria bacterium]
MQFRVIIPARMASQRLPGKPLVELLGKPLILHACERARDSGAAAVLVATDDVHVLEVCVSAGFQAEMTGSGHVSGTDRIAEVTDRFGWEDGDIVVNLQCDEPMMPCSAIRQVAQLLDSHENAHIATLCTPIHELWEYLNPNVVKLVADEAGYAMYFSRAPIPWNREAAPAGLASQQQWQGSLRHIGLYAYRVSTLRRLAGSPPCETEQLEKLEQLRALWLGMKIAVDVARETPGPGVDTPDDLERVALLLRSN